MNASTATTKEYVNKPTNYFSGARRSFIDTLPRNPDARLLEIGCGNGDTASYALAQGKCGWATGVELCVQPATEARDKLNSVIVGDIETLTLPFTAEEFDILVMSEVLEHLRDPWAMLQTVHGFLKPGAIVLAGSPNVSHISVVKMLMAGRWQYESTGIMDRTHLRWFTPSTYARMFLDCGYAVVFVGPARSFRWKARLFNFLTGGRLAHLLHSQISLRGFRL